MKVQISLVVVLFVSSSWAQCGQTPISPSVNKIVGGTTAIPYSYPWQVALSNSNYFQFCGGSIVANDWVLTAAHCVEGSLEQNPSNYGARVALFDKTMSNDGQYISLSKVYKHPNYNGDTMLNDVALLKLSKSLTYGQRIQPVCLPQSDTEALANGADVTITGWGALKSGGTDSATLQQVTVDSVSHSACNSAYGGDIDQKTMVCAARKGKDSCQGDSGGPLVAKTANSWFLYGVVSWGNGCADPNYPGVYARVSTYCSWFKQVTGLDLCSGEGNTATTEANIDTSTMETATTDGSVTDWSTASTELPYESSSWWWPQESTEFPFETSTWSSWPTEDTTEYPIESSTWWWPEDTTEFPYESSSWSPWPTEDTTEYPFESSTWWRPEDSGEFESSTWDYDNTGGSWWIQEDVRASEQAPCVDCSWCKKFVRKVKKAVRKGMLSVDEQTTPNEICSQIKPFKKHPEKCVVAVDQFWEQAQETDFANSGVADICESVGLCPNESQPCKRKPNNHQRPQRRQRPQ